MGEYLRHLRTLDRDHEREYPHDESAARHVHRSDRKRQVDKVDEVTVSG